MYLLFDSGIGTIPSLIAKSIGHPFSIVSTARKIYIGLTSLCITLTPISCQGHKAYCRVKLFVVVSGNVISSCLPNPFQSGPSAPQAAEAPNLSFRTSLHTTSTAYHPLVHKWLRLPPGPLLFYIAAEPSGMVRSEPAASAQVHPIIRPMERVQRGIGLLPFLHSSPDLRT